MDGKSTAWPERAAIALLAFAVALFFGAWFRPILGIPAAMATIWIAWELARRIEPSPMPPKSSLIQIAGVALFLTWTAGLGGMFRQEWDHNFRNALLHDLIDFSWPVIWEYSKGTVVLDYYLAWSLAPALVGKALGWKAATLTAAAIGFAGAFLVMLIFTRVLGVWRWWMPFLVAFWSGLDILGWVLRGKFPGLDVFIDAWSHPVWFLSNLVNFYCVSHLVIPGWIVTILIVGRKVGGWGAVGLSAFLVPLAPFAAIGISPFVLWALLQDSGSLRERLRNVLTPVNVIAPIVFVAMCGPYFFGNRGLGINSGWLWNLWAPPTDTTWIKYTAFWTFEILLPAGVVWLAGQRERLLVLTVAVLCVIPLRSAGLSNDLALKASVPGLFILTLFTARALLTCRPGVRRGLLITVFILGALSPIQQFGRSAAYTYLEPDKLETDYLKSLDPVWLAPYWEAPYVANFRSRPLSELPVLDYMLGHRRGEGPGTPPVVR